MYALDIDLVRDIFAGQPDLLELLRQHAPNPPQDSKRKKWWLPWSRPKLEPSTADNPEPTFEDSENLLAGRYIAPDRLVPSWKLALTWFEVLAPAVLVTSTIEHLNVIEFALARAGLSAEFSLRNLCALDPQVPLSPAPGMTFGYSKHGFVVTAASELRKAFDACTQNEPDEMLTQDWNIVSAIVDFLDGFQDLGQDADKEDQKKPDLIVTLTS